jgi:hypothetical protein
VARIKHEREVSAARSWHPPAPPFPDAWQYSWSGKTNWARRMQTRIGNRVSFIAPEASKFAETRCTTQGAHYSRA